MIACTEQSGRNEDVLVNCQLRGSLLVNLLRAGALTVQDLHCLDQRSQCVLKRSVLESCLSGSFPART